MNNSKYKLAVGSLLHDIGKIAYRVKSNMNHSESGYQFLKGILTDEETLNCIRYHHASVIAETEGIPSNALSYITYVAENIAWAIDKRKDEESEDVGFIRNLSFDSIFNTVTGNNGKRTHNLCIDADKLNIPTLADKEYDSESYEIILNALRETLDKVDYTAEYLASLTEVMRKYTSYIPTSTGVDEVRDISLYAHSKLTTAFALCIYDYLTEQGIDDYAKTLYKNSTAFYSKQAYILYTMKFSGIRDFVYNEVENMTLKSIYNKSFFCDMLIEVITDELIRRLELSSCNKMYVGGGKVQLLLPNTATVKITIKEVEAEVKKYLLDNFGTDIHFGSVQIVCSALDFRNTQGEFSTILKIIDNNLENNRYGYSKNDIMTAGIVDTTIQEKLNDISFNGKDYTIIVTGTRKANSIVLPFGYKALFGTEEELSEYMTDNKYVCSYGKGIGKGIYPNLWLKPYVKENDLNRHLRNSTGTQKLAVLRLNTDNTAELFRHGIANNLMSISRYSELSLKISNFFKTNITDILNNPYTSLNYEDIVKERNVSIVYSNDGELIAVGAWYDVTAFAIDVYDRFKAFTSGTATLSGAIAILSDLPTTMLSLNELLKYSKATKGKDTITIFDKGMSYKWTDFVKEILATRLKSLSQFKKENLLTVTSAHNILKLITSSKGVSVPNLLYIIARNKPVASDGEEKLSQYNNYKSKMYNWVKTEPEGNRYLENAIRLFIYINK